MVFQHTVLPEFRGDTKTYAETYFFGLNLARNNAKYKCLNEFAMDMSQECQGLTLLRLVRFATRSVDPPIAIKM